MKTEISDFIRPSGRTGGGRGVTENVSPVANSVLFNEMLRSMSRSVYLTMSNLYKANIIAHKHQSVMQFADSVFSV